MGYFCCGSSKKGRNFPKTQSQTEREEPNREPKTLRTFTREELAKATANFSGECCVEISSFGDVYRGELESSNCEIVAVEKWDRKGSRGHRDFLEHVSMLSLLDHPNLIDLVGYCDEGNVRILVYEYLPPLGSLDRHLHDRSSIPKPLDWDTRMKIALGVARGVEYIHNTPMIYKNLQTSNILLDDDFNPKLSDFGLSGLGSTLEPHVPFCRQGIGSLWFNAYAAPEDYGGLCLLTVKADVYSFGVVLLELITGRKAVDHDYPRGTKERNLVAWAKNKLKNPEKFPELADPLLQGNFPAKVFNETLTVAAMCLREKVDSRPLMSDVVSALSNLSPGSSTSSSFPA